MHSARLDFSDGVSVLMQLDQSQSRRGHCELNLCDKQGQSALIIAVQHGSHRAMELLAPLEQKHKDNEGRTALHYAAMLGDVTSVAFLVEFEAGIVDNDGCTALFLAIENK